MFWLSIAHGPTVTSISTPAAAFAAVLTLAIGWYGRKWYQSEDDVESLRSRLAGAIRLMWSARLVAVVVVLLSVATLDMWFRAKG